MLKSVKLLSNEHLDRNANDDQNAYHDENDSEDAPSTSHSVASECIWYDEIDSDIDDHDEAAAPFICNVEIILDILAASSLILWNRQIKLSSHVYAVLLTPYN